MRWELERVGAFGSVYKARHKISGEIRAVKIVQKARLNSTMLERIVEEIAILRELVTALNLL